MSYQFVVVASKVFLDVLGKNSQISVNVFKKIKHVKNKKNVKNVKKTWQKKPKNAQPFYIYASLNVNAKPTRDCVNL